MSHKNNLDEMLETTKPVLAKEERELLWQKIADRTITAPVPSPYTSFMQSKIFTTLALVLIVAIGTAGTVAASESAKPGDLLFPIERAAERARLALASNERAAELKTEFAAKRLAELQLIISEEQVAVSATGTATSTQVTNQGEERISLAVNAMLDLLDEFDDDEARAVFLTALIREINLVTVAERNDAIGTEARVKIDDSRIKISDDRYEVEYSDDNGNQSTNDDSSRENDDRDDSSAQRGISFEAEADVFTDITIVEVELNDKKTVFTTSAVTRTQVVDEIVRRYTINRAEVEANLDFEIEDRASQTKDQGNTDDDRRGDDYGSSDDNDRDDDNRDEDDSDSRDDNQSDDSDSQNNDDDDNDRDDDNAKSDSIKKFEIKVEDGRAEVKVEHGEQKLEYETDFITTDALISEVARKTGLSEVSLEAALELELED